MIKKWARELLLHPIKRGHQDSSCPGNRVVRSGFTLMPLYESKSPMRQDEHVKPFEMQRNKPNTLVMLYSAVPDILSLFSRPFFRMMTPGFLRAAM